MSAPHRHSVPLDPGPRSADYVPRCPEQTPLYIAFAEELGTFLARRRDDERHLPRFVERELRGFLDCGILAHGFLRVRCPVCREARLVRRSWPRPAGSSGCSTPIRSGPASEEAPHAGRGLPGSE